MDKNKIIIENLQDHNMCLYDTENKIVGAKYLFLADFNHDNYWIASNDFNYYFIVDFFGNIVSNNNVCKIHAINSEGVGFIQTKDNKYYLIDQNLNKLSDQFFLIKEFNGKNKWVASDGIYEFLIDANGKQINNKKFKSIEPDRKSVV